MNTSTTTDIKPRFLTANDFVATYGVGRTTLYNLIAEGTLRAVKVGKRMLVDAATVEAWADSLPEAKIHYHNRKGMLRTAA